MKHFYTLWWAEWDHNTDAYEAVWLGGDADVDLEAELTTAAKCVAAAGGSRAKDVNVLDAIAKELCNRTGLELIQADHGLAVDDIWAAAVAAHKDDDVFTVTDVNPDWDGDETLFERDDEFGENLYRLDFADRENEYQAQLFLITAVDEATFDKLLQDDDPIPYRSARLFLERDNRHPDGSCDRIDYACQSWPCTKDDALRYLRCDREQLIAAIAAQIAEVEAMPCDHAFLDKHYSFDEKMKRYAWWYAKQQKETRGDDPC